MEISLIFFDITCILEENMKRRYQRLLPNALSLRYLISAFCNSKAMLFIHFLFAFGQGLENKFTHAFNFGSLRFGIQMIWTQFNIHMQPLYTLYFSEGFINTVSWERQLDLESGVLGLVLALPPARAGNLGDTFTLLGPQFSSLRNGWVDSMVSEISSLSDILWLCVCHWWPFWSSTEN